jgi:hypothetical protein
MPIRPLIVALLWLTYALSLGHNLLPHHHDHEEHSAHRQTTAAHHHEGDHDHESKDAADEADWWFGHKHTPGVEFSQLTSADTYQTPPAADLIAIELPRFTVCIRWMGQTVGWPPTQSKAPPGGQNPFRPLRAPPTTSVA